MKIWLSIGSPYPVRCEMHALVVVAVALKSESMNVVFAQNPPTAAVVSFGVK